MVSAIIPSSREQDYLVTKEIAVLIIQSCTCIKPFTRNDSLMKHINKGRCRTQGVPCNECGRFFKSSWYLKRHLHVHEPKNVYKCENCKKTYFRRKSYLKHKCVNDILHINVSSLTNRENVAEHHLPSDIEQSSIDKIDMNQMKMWKSK